MQAAEPGDGGDRPNAAAGERESSADRHHQQPELLAVAVELLVDAIRLAAQTEAPRPHQAAGEDQLAAAVERGDQIGRALPLSGLFTLATTALLCVAYRPGWRGAGGLLLTTGVLILSLGLNISVLGLVGVPRAALGVLAEVFTLLVALGGVYAGVVVILNRSRFGGASSA